MVYAICGRQFEVIKSVIVGALTLLRSLRKRLPSFANAERVEPALLR